MKRVAKKVPLFPFSAQKDTLISDLLTQKKVTFSENSLTCMVTHFIKVVPRGVNGLIAYKKAVILCYA